MALLCANIASADVTLLVTNKGLPTGTIRLSIRFSGKSRTDREQILPPGKGPAKTIEWNWNDKGEPTKITFSMPSTAIIDGHPSSGTTSIVTTFPPNKESQTTIRVPGKTIHQKTPVQPGLINDPTAFWFVRDHPKPGDSFGYYAFDIQNLKWNEVDRTFIGRQPVTGYIGDLNVVKEVRDGVETLFYLDDRAEPVLVVSGDMRMVRQ